MGQRFQIHSAACFFLALGLLILPLNWVVAALLAAAIHELCHYLTAKLMGITVHLFSIHPGGCLMTTGYLTKKQELICAAAGPLGSLTLLLFIRVSPILALCGLVQGLYNLLPIYPMDGGRILRCIVGEDVSDRIERIFCFMILVGGTILTVYLDMGLSPLLFALILFVKTGKMKNPLQTTTTKSTIDLPKIKR